jgi:galactonate dehydratase
MYMKITDVETIFADRFLFVKVHTDTGIVGLGECGTWGYLEAAAKVIEKYRKYLIGQDPLKIEHHWQYMYRWSHFRGAAIMGAISAIDIALWDIAGKHFDVPVYQLLGGKTRDLVRVYVHVFGNTTEELVRNAVKAKAMGFTAVGHISPFIPESPNMPHSKKMADAVERVRLYREALGDDVDICLEIHRQLTPTEAIVLGRAVEPFRPYFFEDPILPDSIEQMAFVSSHIHIPIATGERLHTIFEFEELLARNAVQYIRPDVCMAGGLTHCKKIAALAEARYVGVVPHNPLSPVSTAACVQLDACIPNFAIQEYPHSMSEEAPRGNQLVKKPLCIKKGCIVVPEEPGIGVELDDSALEKFPPVIRELSTRLRYDGSVIDQ